MLDASLNSHFLQCEDDQPVHIPKLSSTKNLALWTLSNGFMENGMKALASLAVVVPMAGKSSGRAMLALSVLSVSFAQSDSLMADNAMSADETL